MIYGSKHIAILYGVSLETIRNWSDEFSDYLSTTANPGKGRHRNFTQEDMGIISLVAQYKKQGLTYEDVHVALKSGQRGEIPTMGPDEIIALITDDNERALISQVDTLMRQVDVLQTELERLKELEKEGIRLKADLETERRIRIETEKNLKEANEKMMARMMELERELGRAQGLLEYLKERQSVS